MALKIAKVLWVFSLLAVLAVFMYVYASLPETVVVNENGVAVSLSKETVFYIALALLGVSNALVFAVSRIFPEQEQGFKAWFYGLIILANLFFIVGLSFVSLYNGGEKYDYNRLGFIIYGSVSLVAIWTVAWPLYRIAQRLLSKPVV